MGTIATKCCKCTQQNKIYKGIEGGSSYYKIPLQFLHRNNREGDNKEISTITNWKITEGLMMNSLDDSLLLQSISESEICPEFIRTLTDLSVKVGTRIRFLVEIQSQIIVKVSWYRNEMKLIDSNRISLGNEGTFYSVQVSPVIPEDEGQWTCIAENIAGRNICTSNLKVLIPRAYKCPEFVQDLKAILTDAGTVSLECKVIGIPTPILRWYKDNIEIKPGDIFALNASASDTDPTSLGIYTCEAFNCMGFITSSSKVHLNNNYQLNVPSNLHLVEGLNEARVKIGEIHLLTLTLNQHIPICIEWYNKDELIPITSINKIQNHMGRIISLELNPVELSDEGEWKCIIFSNESKQTITSTCHLTIIIPKNYRKPSFLENLKAILTDEGLVSFECKVIGYPTPILHWFKDGIELKPGDVYQLSGSNSLGIYTCKASNCMGKVESNATLTLEDIQHSLSDEEKQMIVERSTSLQRPPKFHKGLKSVDIKIMEPLHLSIESSDIVDNITWYCNNEMIVEGGKYIMKKVGGEYSLKIDSSELMDNGEWRTVIRNQYGHSMTSCIVKLCIPNFYRKPKFLESLKAILSCEGTVNLECKVIGVPQPILTWYKDNVELKPGDIHRIISGLDGSCSLGTYTCEAKNCMGIVTSSAALLGFEDTQIHSEGIEEKMIKTALDSLSTILEERSSQIQSIYETPLSDPELSISISLDGPDGKEISISLYETPDLTEADAKVIVEMFAQQISENISESGIVALPSLRFTKEASRTGPLKIEAIVIDVVDFENIGGEGVTENDLLEDLSLDEYHIPLEVEENNELFDLVSLTSIDNLEQLGEMRESSLMTPVLQDEQRLQNYPFEMEAECHDSQLKDIEVDSSEYFNFAGESMASYELFPLEKRENLHFENLNSLEDQERFQYEKMVTSLVGNEMEGLLISQDTHFSQINEMDSNEFLPENIDEQKMTILERQAQINELQQHLSQIGQVASSDEKQHNVTRAEEILSQKYPLHHMESILSQLETLSDIDSIETFIGNEVDEDGHFPSECISEFRPETHKITELNGKLTFDRPEESGVVRDEVTGKEGVSFFSSDSDKDNFTLDNVQTEIPLGGLEKMRENHNKPEKMKQMDQNVVVQEYNLSSTDDFFDSTTIDIPEDTSRATANQNVQASDSFGVSGQNETVQVIAGKHSTDRKDKVQTESSVKSDVFQTELAEFGTEFSLQTVESNKDEGIERLSKIRQLDDAGQVNEMKHSKISKADSSAEMEEEHLEEIEEISLEICGENMTEGGPTYLVQADTVMLQAKEQTAEEKKPIDLERMNEVEAVELKKEERKGESDEKSKKVVDSIPYEPDVLGVKSSKKQKETDEGNIFDGKQEQMTEIENKIKVDEDELKGTDEAKTKQKADEEGLKEQWKEKTQDREHGKQKLEDKMLKQAGHKMNDAEEKELKEVGVNDTEEQNLTSNEDRKQGNEMKRLEEAQGMKKEEEEEKWTIEDGNAKVRKEKLQELTTQKKEADERKVKGVESNDEAKARDSEIKKREANEKLIKDEIKIKEEEKRLKEKEAKKAKEKQIKNEEDEKEAYEELMEDDAKKTEAKKYKNDAEGKGKEVRLKAEEENISEEKVKEDQYKIAEEKTPNEEKGKKTGEAKLKEQVKLPDENMLNREKVRKAEEKKLKEDTKKPENMSNEEESIKFEQKMLKEEEEKKIKGNILSEEAEKKEAEEKLREDAKKKEAEKLREDASKKGAEKLREETKKKEAEEKLKDEAKKQKAEDKLKEDAKKKEIEEKLREEAEKKEADEKLKEEAKKREAEEKLKKESEEKLKYEATKKEAEEKLREEAKKKDGEEKLKEEAKKREAGKKLKEEAKKKEAEEKLREEVEKREAEEAKKKEADEKLREEAKKKKVDEKLREEAKKKDAEEKLKEEAKKKEAEEKLREEAKKKDAEEKLREEVKKKEAEEKLREEAKKKVAEEKLREEVKKKEAEEKLKKEAEEKLREEAKKKVAEEKLREEVKKKEAEEKLKEEAKKKEAEEKLKEEAKKKEAEEKLREETKKKEAEEKLKEEAKKKEAEEKLREETKKKEAEEKLKEEAKKKEAEEKLREETKKKEAEEKLKEEAKNNEAAETLREEAKKKEAAETLREEAKKKEAEEKLKEEAKKKEAEEKLKEEAKKKDAEEKLRKEAKKKETEEKLREEAKKNEAAEKLREEAKKKEAEEKLKEEAKKKEAAETLREEAKKKEAKEKLREEAKKKESEEKLRKEAKKKETEEKLREEVKKEAEEKLREETKKKEAEETFREEAKKKEAEENLREEAKKKEAEEKLREEAKKKGAEEKLREEAKKKEAEEKLREEAKKKDAEEKLREEVKKKETEKKLREETKKKETEETFREEAKKKEAEENLREGAKKKEAEEKLKEEAKKKEAEEKLKEEAEKKEAEEKLKEEAKQKEAEEKLKEEAEKEEAEEKLKEEAKKKEVEEKLREGAKKKEAEEKLKEEAKKKEAEEKLKEEAKKKEAEEKLKEEAKKKEAEEKLREEAKKKEAEEKLREEAKKKEAEERFREEVKKKEAAETLREEAKKKETEEKLREEVMKKEAEEKLREEVKKKGAEEKLVEEAKKKEAERLKEGGRRKESEEKKLSEVVGKKEVEEKKLKEGEGQKKETEDKKLKEEVPKKTEEKKLNEEEKDLKEEGAVKLEEKMLKEVEAEKAEEKKLKKEETVNVEDKKLKVEEPKKSEEKSNKEESKKAKGKKVDEEEVENVEEKTKEEEEKVRGNNLKLEEAKKEQEKLNEEAKKTEEKELKVEETKKAEDKKLKEEAVKKSKEKDKLNCEKTIEMNLKCEEEIKTEKSDVSKDSVQEEEANKLKDEERLKEFDESKRKSKGITEEGRLTEESAKIEAKKLVQDAIKEFAEEKLKIQAEKKSHEAPCLSEKKYGEGEKIDQNKTKFPKMGVLENISITEDPVKDKCKDDTLKTALNNVSIYEGDAKLLEINEVSTYIEHKGGEVITEKTIMEGCEDKQRVAEKKTSSEITLSGENEKYDLGMRGKNKGEKFEEAKNVEPEKTLAGRRGSGKKRSADEVIGTDFKSEITKQLIEEIIDTPKATEEGANPNIEKMNRGSEGRFANGSVETNQERSLDDDRNVESEPIKPMRRNKGLSAEIDEIRKSVDNSSLDSSTGNRKPQSFDELDESQSSYASITTERLRGKSDTLKETNDELDNREYEHLNGVEKSLELQRQEKISDHRRKLEEKEQRRCEIRKEYEAHRYGQEAIREGRSTPPPASEDYNHFFLTDNERSRDALRRPKFSLKLMDRVSAYGCDVILTATVLGHPTPALQWYRNGLALSPDGVKIAISSKSGVTVLIVKNSGKGDMAEYTCLARNSYGKAATSCIVTLLGEPDKKPQPAGFSRGIFESTSGDNDELVLECKVKGHPLPMVMWLHNNEILIPFLDCHSSSILIGRVKSIINFDGRVRLIIRNPGESDSGIYSCVARNDSWTDEAQLPLVIKSRRVHHTPLRQQTASPVSVSDTSQTPSMFMRKVRESTPIIGAEGMTPPKFLLHPEEDMVVEVGSDLVLQCRVGGEPKPRVNLYRGCRDVTLQPRGFRETLDSSLIRFTLKRVELMDGGMYTLEAKNIYGKERIVTRVKVMGERRFEQNSRRTRSMTPKLYGGGYDSSHSLQVFSSSQDVPDKIQIEPIISEVGPGWVSLRWTRPHSTATLLAYKIEALDIDSMHEPGLDHWIHLGISPIPSFEAFHLKPGQEYLFRITPRNRFGWGDSIITSNPVLIKERSTLPEFTQILPTHIKACRGDILQLDCQVSGEPKPTIRWYKDNEILPNEICTRIKLPAEEVDFRVTCRATNLIGYVTSFANITIVDDPLIVQAHAKLQREETILPPTITFRLQDRMVPIGYPLRLTCQIKGSKPLQVQFRKDDNEISSIHEVTKDKNDFYTLELNCVKINDGGIYSCIAINQFGHVETTSTLIVHNDRVIGPSFIKELDTITIAHFGNMVSLECQVEAWPSITTQWRKNGIRIDRWNHRKFFFKSTKEGHVVLLVNDVGEVDTGEYTVTVTNAMGSISSTTQLNIIPKETLRKVENRLAVLEPERDYNIKPHFTRKPEALEVFEGDRVLIECSIQASPIPKTQWYRDGLNPSCYRDKEHFLISSIESTDYAKATEHRLEIPCVQFTHTGAYTIQAANEHGECKAIVSLQVKARELKHEKKSKLKVSGTRVVPRILQPLTTMKVTAGDSVTLKFDVEGSDLEFIWEFGKIFLKPNKLGYEIQQNKLILRKVYRQDEGIYKCIVKNYMGKCETSALLLVEPSKTESTTLIGNSILGEGQQSGLRIKDWRSGITPLPPCTIIPSPPKFKILPNNKIANEGESVQFHCSIIGHVDSTTTRMILAKNNQPIDTSNGSRFQIKQNSSPIETEFIYEIQSVTSADNGQYEIILENEFGRVVATTKLDVIPRAQGFNEIGEGMRLRALSSSPIRQPIRLEDQTSFHQQMELLDD